MYIYMYKGCGAHLPNSQPERVAIGDRIQIPQARTGGYYG